MTDIDADAIKAREREAALAMTKANGWDINDLAAVCYRSSQDVPALLARLAEVEAERDAALVALTEAMDHNDQTCEAVAARDNLAAENARLRQDADDWARAHRYYELRAEMDEVWRLLGAWHDAGGKVGVPFDVGAWNAWVAACGVLHAAVDAYRAGQKAPGRVDPADLAIPDLTDEERQAFAAAASEGPASPPESTLDAEQAEPAVASTNTAQAQRGVQGDVEVICQGCGKPALDHLPPADPPGLDAAIEAAREVECEHFVGCLACKVRAAAPALRAGALRAEADSLLDEIRLQSSWLWYELGESALEKLAQRLRERADRKAAT